MLRCRLTEIGAVGNLYEIADFSYVVLRGRSKRNPAIKRKVLSVKGGHRHLSHIVPLGCALRSVSRRPLPCMVIATAACALMELSAAVAVAEIRECVAAVLIELQICVLQLLFKVLLRRVYCKGELNCALAVLYLQRRFLYLYSRTCEGDQLGHTLFGTHTRIIHRLAFVPEIGTEDTPVPGGDFLVEDLTEALWNFSGNLHILACGGIECVQT